MKELLENYELYKKELSDKWGWNYVDVISFEGFMVWLKRQQEGPVSDNKE